MLSQLSKTIKMALKSSQEERAILRARSAVQRFPVVEWRQRMEDFHKRSIQTSRTGAASNAWRQSDGEIEPTYRVAVDDTEDWDPAVGAAEPEQPNWDSRSINDSMHNSINLSQSGLAPYEQQLLPPRMQSDEFGRRGSAVSLNSDYSDVDEYYAHSHNPSVTDIHSDNGHGGFDSFLAKANRQIARDQRHLPDPFLNPADAASAVPQRLFLHNRMHSVESIASIVDEKSTSVLNKAIASVRLYVAFTKTCLTSFSSVHGRGW